MLGSCFKAARSLLLPGGSCADTEEHVARVKSRSQPLPSTDKKIATFIPLDTAVLFDRSVRVQRADGKADLALYVTRELLPQPLRDELDGALDGSVQRLVDFLEADCTHNADTRTPVGTMKAGLGLRFDNQHLWEEAGGVGYWMRNVAHPHLMEALLPLVRVLWRLFCSYAPEKAALAEAYASRLRQYGVEVIPGTGAFILRLPSTPSLTRRAAAFTTVWVADKTAVAHRDAHVASNKWQFGDMVVAVHTRPGRVRGGELVIVDHDGTRIALEMEHASLAIVDAYSHIHASVPVTAAHGERRLVLSLFSDVRLLKWLEEGCITRWPTWPPSAEQTAEARTKCKRGCYGCSLAPLRA